MYKIGENIILEISKDGLYGYVTLINDELDKKVQFDKNKCLDEIKKYIKYGLDESLLIRILDNNITEEKFCIAAGKASTPGKDGSIKYNFELDKTLSPKINNDGTVDYRELNSLNNVKEGDILAIIIPPIEGVDGIRVDGQIIPHLKGKTPRFKYGKNVNITPDEMYLVSDKSGLVELKDGKVIVSEILVLQNVDNTVGNIIFEGNVIVNKDILNGFTLKSNGSVEVKGAVEGGYIHCAGDILVRQGIQGYNRLTINTKGNLSAKFIENSVIVAGKNITAEAIMHSDISSRSNILVLGKKGLLVGGICRAKNEIRAKVIGSAMATTTVLEVGIDPKIKHSHDELNNKLNKAKENLEKIEQSLNVLEVLKRSNKLDNKKEELYNELVKAQLTINLEINKRNNDLVNIKKDLNDLSKGKIKVADTIYPGVKIVIGNSFMYIRDEMHKCTFYEENGEIRVGPY